MVRIQLLGGVSATTDTGEPLDVGPAKCRALLAALALSLGEAVPVSRLVDILWGESPPRTADKTLQGYVVQLRRGLGNGAIVRTGTAYRLVLGGRQVEDAAGPLGDLGLSADDLPLAIELAAARTCRVSASP